MLRQLNSTPSRSSRNRRKTHLQELEETVEHLRRENDILRAGGTVDPSERPRSESRLASYDDDVEEDVDDDDEDDFKPTPRDRRRRHRRVSENSTNDDIASAPSSTFSGWEIEKPSHALVEENTALRKRLAELEEMILKASVNQVTTQLVEIQQQPQPTFSINGQLVVPDLKMPSFVTPVITSQIATALPLSPTSSSTSIPTSTQNLNLTCHPAAMATLLASSEAGKALQRVSLMVQVGEKVEEWTLDVAIK